MIRCLLALGSNLGDPTQMLRLAVEELDALPETKLLAVSQFHETAAVGGPAGQAGFQNAAAVVQTRQAPEDLMSQLLAIESRLGRQRDERWAARTLDIDLLLFGRQVINQSGLVIPHPRMTFRPFVMAPAVEVAGEQLHPLLGRTLTDLLSVLHDGPDEVVLLAGEPALRKGVAQQVQRRRPGVGVRGESTRHPPKLTIVVGDPSPLPGAGPTLWVSPSHSPERIEQEVDAALQCVWPEE